jgi:hypothetical protein
MSDNAPTVPYDLVAHATEAVLLAARSMFDSEGRNMGVRINLDKAFHEVQLLIGRLANTETPFLSRQPKPMAVPEGPLADILRMTQS